MAKITLSDAAKLTGTSRTTLYRAIKAGTLSRDPDDTIDTAELLRAGFELRQPAPSADAMERAAAHHDALPMSHPLEQAVAAVEHERTLWERERDLLLRELATAHAREAAARDREVQLLSLLVEEQKQRQRLLEAGTPPTRVEPQRRRWWRRRR